MAEARRVPMLRWMLWLLAFASGLAQPAMARAQLLNNLTNTGAKLRKTSRTLAAAVSRLSRSLPVSASTTGNCTKNCKALPTTEPQAR